LSHPSLRVPSLVRPAFLAAALATLPGPAAHAVPELWVDGPAAVQPGASREYPDAAEQDDGTTIFVWTARDAPGGIAHDIFLRRFDVDGSPLEDPRMINTTVASTQKRPQIAVAPDGSFLVVWQSSEHDDATGDQRIWVRSQAFTADGATTGSEQLVSNLSSGNTADIHADVAALVGGGYVAVWRSQNSTGTDGDNSIQARLISSAGVPQGSQFQVNTQTSGGQKDPAVAALDDGGFVVAWTNPEVYLRPFTAGGTSAVNDIQVDTTTAGGPPTQTEIARGWDGRLIVVWTTDENLGLQGEIRARLYDAALNPLGNDFRINSLTTGAQSNAHVGDLGPLGFLVAWDSDTSAGDDTSSPSIQMRIVTGSDLFSGAQAQLNVYTADVQKEVWVGGRYGLAAAVWRSAGNFDSTNIVIEGLLWRSCLFCDDFEWGGLGRWPTQGPAPTLPQGP